MPKNSKNFINTQEQNTETDNLPDPRQLNMYSGNKEKRAPEPLKPPTERDQEIFSAIKNIVQNQEKSPFMDAFLNASELGGVSETCVEICCKDGFSAGYIRDNIGSLVKSGFRELYKRDLEVLYKAIAPQARQEIEKPKALEKANPKNLEKDDPGAGIVVGWSEKERAMPNELLRSSLFGSVKRGLRKRVIDKPLICWGGVSITFSGTELDQGDCDVFFEILNLIKQQGKSKVHFSVYSLLTSLGKNQSGKSRQTLKRQMSRLVEGTIKIESATFVYEGHLLNSFMYDKESKDYVSSANEDFLVMFKRGYARIDKTIRNELETSLAKGLYNFIATHRAPRPKPQRVKLEQLKEILGADGEMKKFKFNVKTCMTQLQKQKVVTLWGFEGDTLLFSKPKTRRKPAWNKA